MSIKKKSIISWLRTELLLSNREFFFSQALAILEVWTGALSYIKIWLYVKIIKRPISFPPN